MRITIALPAYWRQPIGGYHVHYHYANLMSRRGHAVTLLFPRHLKGRSGLRPHLGTLAWATKLRLRYRPLITSYPIDLNVNTKLVRDLETLPDADVLIATAWQTAEAVADAPARCGRKHYIVYDYEYWMTADDVDRARIAATYRAGFTMVATSAVVEDTIRSCGGTPAARIPCGLDFTKFGLDRPPSERVKFTVGFPARPEPFKGAADAVAAGRILRARYGDRVRIACFGSRGMDLPDWIEQHHSPSPEALRAFYNQQSVFLTPSHFEGWGLTGVEAMACGAALVTADNGGCRDYAFDGETALVTPPHSPERLAEAVGRLFEDDALRLRLAETGRQFVSRFTWEQAGVQLGQLLEGAATPVRGDPLPS